MKLAADAAISEKGAVALPERMLAAIGIVRPDCGESPQLYCDWENGIQIRGANGEDVEKGIRRLDRLNRCVIPKHLREKAGWLRDDGKMGIDTVRLVLFGGVIRVQPLSVPAPSLQSPHCLLCLNTQATPLDEESGISLCDDCVSLLPGRIQILMKYYTDKVTADTRSLDALTAVYESGPIQSMMALSPEDASALDTEAGL